MWLTSVYYERDQGWKVKWKCWIEKETKIKYDDLKDHIGLDSTLVSLEDGHNNLKPGMREVKIKK